MIVKEKIGGLFFDLIQGDCLEEMQNIKTESIDCIITDPPYNVISGGQTKTANAFFKGEWKNDGKIFKHNDVVLSMLEFVDEYIKIEKLKLQRDLIIMKHIQISTNASNLSIKARDVREELENLIEAL